MNEKQLALMLGIVTALSYSLIYILFGYGVDITDEGFYLAMISTPNSYPETTSHFGYILNLFWRGVDGDVVLFRQLNSIVIFFLAWVLLFSINVKNKKCLSLPELALISTIFAFSVFSYFIYWIATPSYNSLNLVSLLLVSIGVVLAGYKRSYVINMGYLMIGLGSFLCFVTKPTSAAALGVFLLFWFLYKLKNSLNRNSIYLGLFISLSCSASLMLCHSYFNFGSLLNVVDNLILGLENGKLLLGENWSSFSNILWKGNLDLSSAFSSILAVSFIFSGLFLLRITRANKYLYKSQVTLIFITIFVVVLIVLSSYFFYEFNPLSTFNNDDKFLITWLPIFLIVIVLLFLNLIKHGFCERVAQTLLLLAMPYIYTIGTASEYYVWISATPIFGFAAISSLISINSNSQKYRVLPLIFLGAFVVGLTSLIVGSAVKSPYRQISMPQFLDEENSFTEVSDGRLKGLKLNTDLENHLKKLSTAAKQNGFIENTPVIDMTGASPGVLFAIEAKNLGVAWLLGGYPGSEHYAINILSRASKEDLDRAWLLLENNSEWRRQLPESVLESLGKNIKNDYILVVKSILPEGIGGRSSTSEQSLYKPKK